MSSNFILGAAAAAAALAMIMTAIALVVTKKKPGRVPPALALFPLAVAILGVVFILALLLNMNEFCRVPKQAAVSSAPATPQPSIQLPDKRPPQRVCVDREKSEQDAGRYIITKDICVTGYDRVDEMIAAEIEKQEKQFLQGINAPELAPLSVVFALRLSTDESMFDRLPEVQSVKLNIDRSLGGAHPTLDFRTWTFDRLTDRVVDFELLFKSGRDPRPVLLDYVKKQLNVSDTDSGNWSFENFMVVGDELHFLFAPGMLAPYAAGTQTVKIPFAEIQSVLRPPFLDISNATEDDYPTPEADHATPCEKEGGNWLAAYNECEYVSSDWCEQRGGTFLECESACRHDDSAVMCTLQCVQVCKL